MNKKYLQMIPSIVLYVFAGLLAVYAIWSFAYCADIISQAKAAGQLAANGNEYDIASFYMSNCAQYFVFALLLTATGFLLHKKQPATGVVENAPSASSEKSNANDDELDEWFDEMSAPENLSAKMD
jgi:hypothetical protein